MHPQITISHSITRGDVVKFNWHPPCFPYPNLNSLSQFSQMKMPRQEFIPGVCHCHKWPVQVSIIEIHRFEEGASFVVRIFWHLPTIELTKIEPFFSVQVDLPPGLTVLISIGLKV
jgi:hypothetical protein